MTGFREVAQRWAERGERQLTGGSAFTRAGALCSHRTVIAKIIERPLPGQPVALVTTRQYSTGTSRLRNLAACEARKAGLEVFEVQDVAPVSAADHADNIRAIRERIDANAGKRKSSQYEQTRLFYDKEVRKLRKMLLRYCTVFGIEP